MRKVLIGLLLSALATPLLAENRNCKFKHIFYDQLAEQYGEQRIIIGTAGETMMEVWANAETGSWTLLRTHPDGTACILVGGENYVPALALAQVLGDPA